MQRAAGTHETRALWAALHHLMLPLGKVVRFKASKRAWARRLSARRPTGRPSRKRTFKRYSDVVHVYWRAGVQRPVWMAWRAALRQASASARAVQRRGRPAKALWRRAALDPMTVAAAAVEGAEYAPGERVTLEIGSCIALSAVGLGLTFGRWPVWSVAVAAGGYLTWVVIYSEATVQARRRRPADRRLVAPELHSADSASPPAKENVPA